MTLLWQRHLPSASLPPFLPPSLSISLSLFLTSPPFLSLSFVLVCLSVCLSLFSLRPLLLFLFISLFTSLYLSLFINLSIYASMHSWLVRMTEYMYIFSIFVSRHLKDPKKNNITNPRGMWGVRISTAWAFMCFSIRIRVQLFIERRFRLT